MNWIIPTLTFLLGWAGNRILDNAWHQAYNSYQRKRLLNKSKFINLNYNPEKNGLIQLHAWSYSHRLQPENTIMKKGQRPDSDLIKRPGEFEKLVEKYKAQNFRGEVCYMVDYNVDHQDNEYGKSLEITLAPCDYSESEALGEYCKLHPELVAEVKQLLNRDTKEYFKKALPSVVFMNLIIVSEDDNILVLRRSRAVASAQGLWCVGAYETMEYPFSSTACNDSSFHKLATRCLAEEIGIRPVERIPNQAKTRRIFDDDSIFISSMSLSTWHMGILITAIVKLKNISEEELTNRIISQAHSKYEHDGLQWLPINITEIKNFIEKDTGIYTEFVNANNGRWIDYTKWSLYELARIIDFDKYKA